MDGAAFWLYLGMNADEKDIVDYLKAWPNSFISGREIARKVGGKRRYQEDRHWAIPILAQMVRIGLIEADSYGGFRLVSHEKKKKRNHREIAPQILRILKSSGKSFDGISIDNDIDEEDLAIRSKTSRPPGSSGDMGS